MHTASIWQILEKGELVIDFVPAVSEDWNGNQLGQYIAFLTDTSGTRMKVIDDFNGRLACSCAQILANKVGYSQDVYSQMSRLPIDSVLLSPFSNISNEKSHRYFTGQVGLWQICLWVTFPAIRGGGAFKASAKWFDSLLFPSLS